MVAIDLCPIELLINALELEGLRAWVVALWSDATLWRGI